MDNNNWWNDFTHKVSLNGDFMTLLPMHPYFENSAEEFHPRESLSTPMKLLSSLSSPIRCHISLFNAYETLMKPRWDWPKVQFSLAHSPKLYLD